MTQNSAVVPTQYQTQSPLSQALISLHLLPASSLYSIKDRLSRRESREYNLAFSQPYAGMQAYAYPHTSAVTSQLQPARPLYPTPLSQSHFQGKQWALSVSSPALAVLSFPLPFHFHSSRSLLYFEAALLRSDLHIVQFTLFGCIIQGFLKQVYRVVQPFTTI